MTNQTLFKGTPVKLAGQFVEFGMKAPDFSLTTAELTRFTLASGKGKRLLLNIFPSIDTAVCSLSVRKFNEFAAGLNQTLVLCISKDLPFAQSRFCGAEGLKNVITLSDFHCDSTFGTDYGVLMKSGLLDGLLARAVVIIAPDGTIAYADLSQDITEEPDYEAALKILEAR